MQTSEEDTAALLKTFLEEGKKYIALKQRLFTTCALIEEMIINSTPENFLITMTAKRNEEDKYSEEAFAIIHHHRGNAPGIRYIAFREKVVTSVGEGDDEVFGTRETQIAFLHALPKLFVALTSRLRESNQEAEAVLEKVRI